MENAIPAINTERDYTMLKDHLYTSAKILIL